MELTKLAQAYERKGAKVIGFKSDSEMKEVKKKKNPKEEAKSLKRKIDKVENAPLQVVAAPDASV